MAESTRYQRFISGLLGENIQGMSEEDRKRLSREGTTAAILGMLSGSGLLGGLEGYGKRRKENRALEEAARRTAAAEAEMPRIAGRLFGGSAGMIETLPGQPEEETRLMTSRYRQAPQEALSRLYGTQEGRDVATMAPDLAKLASEGTLGVTVGGSRLYPLTGRMVKPPEAQVQTLSPQEVARLGLPRGTLVQRDPGGELKILREPPRMAAGGGGGLGQSQVLTPAEVRAMGFEPGSVVRRRDLVVLQRPGEGGATPAEGPMAGMNERQRSGANIVRDAALQYAANITGLTLQEISKKSPVEIENLIKEKGGRVTQGGRARMAANLPIVGDFARGIVEAANADLIGPSTSGGAGVAMTQNPTGPITGPDVEIGIRQFPNPMLPLNVQAQMIRSLLERGGVVEQYDEKGNKVTR